VPVEYAGGVDGVGRVVVVRAYVVVEGVVVVGCFVEVEAARAETLDCGAFVAGAEGGTSGVSIGVLRNGGSAGCLLVEGFVGGGEDQAEWGGLDVVVVLCGCDCCDGCEGESCELHGGREMRWLIGWELMQLISRAKFASRVC
jgi:hypothetical protein